MKWKGEPNRFLLISIILGVCVFCGLVVIVLSGSRARRSLMGMRIDSFHELVLERSGCFGSCPIYKLVVMGNGEVIFEGREYTEVKGELKDRITDDQVKRLVEAINQSDFFALGDSYVNELDGCVVWSDQATVTTRVVTQNRTKTITHYLGCAESEDDSAYPRDDSAYPRALSELEIEIDKIVDTDRWTDPRRHR